MYRLKPQNKVGELLDKFVLLRLCYVLNFKTTKMGFVFFIKVLVLHLFFSKSQFTHKNEVFSFSYDPKIE
jgi:hypothetical protein